jgi:hypothetical protein
MRRPKLKTQHYMVAIVFLAIFFWAAPVLIPDILRRWFACEERAAWHAKEAAALRARIAKSPEARELQYHTEKSQMYRSSLYIPWRFYTLGDTPSWR